MKSNLVMNLSLRSVFLVTLFVFSVVVGAVELPDTPVGKRAGEFVDLVNSGDMEKAKVYIERNYTPDFKNAFPMDMHMGFIRQVHGTHERVEIGYIEQASESSMDFLLYSPSSGAWLAVHMEVEPVDAHRISRIGLQPSPAPDDAEEPRQEARQEEREEGDIPVPEEPLTAEKLRDYINALIDDLVHQDNFSGAVLVAKDGVPLYKRAVGEANKSYRIPNRIDTKFNLGSMNKMFTGVAIVQLVQQGKLHFDDLVGKYLSDYPNEDVRDKVTIHHLLTHTSGMGLYWREFFANPRWAHLKSVQDFDDLANTNPLAFEPGERFFYSNCGPLVLGLIIEKISGMSYDDYIRRHVTGPAGMTNTDCYDISIPVSNLAIGYTKTGPFGENYNEWRNNLFINPVKGGPAGGGYSTVEDLLKFDIALRSHILLEQRYFDMMTTAKAERDAGRGYAYLFQEEIVNGHRIIGHSGGAAGINSDLAMYMDLGYTVAIMTNTTQTFRNSGMIILRRQIKELLTRE